MWMDAMPQPARMMIRQGLVDTATLVSIPAVASCTIEDVKRHAFWCRSLVEAYPLQVPSGYLIADAILVLDTSFKGLLLNGDKNSQALDMANSLKRLIQKVL